jgi:hypothetical protein
MRYLEIINVVDFHFVVPPPLRDTENNQTHYVGKLWRIDCRIKDNNSSEGRLYQNGMLREPDDRVLILKEQVFMLLSEKLSDIGEYTCEYCNISKTVGKLIAGIKHLTILSSRSHWHKMY